MNLHVHTFQWLKSHNTKHVRPKVERLITAVHDTFLSN